MIPSAVDLMQPAIRAHLARIAEPCPECGGKLAGEGIEQRSTYHEQGTGDSVVDALEMYRCQDCGKRIYRLLELDRETAQEKLEERDRCLLRAERSREEPFLWALFRPGAWYREVVCKEIPHRPEVDLMERYAQRSASNQESKP